MSERDDRPDAATTPSTRATAPTVPADASDLASFDGGKAGRYLLLREIGRGAMGHVYAGFDPDLGRRVAVKLVPDASHVFARYLMQEARMLASLSHPNIVPVFDIGEDGDRVFIVMELVDGVSLADWLAASPRSPRDIVRVWCAAGRGLAAAHAAGVIHRDVKASNVLISHDGHVRVADFGLARPTADASDPSIEGTRGYMAPEVFERGVASEAADQYAYCVSLFHALTGRYPAGGGVDDARIPRRIRKLLQRGLAEDPAARWPSIAELVDALERTQRIRRVQWLAAGTAVVGLAGYALWPAGTAASSCEVPAALVDRYLPHGARARLAASIHTVPAGDPLATQVELLLTRSLASWTSRYERDCAVPMRARCLEGKLGELATLVEDASTAGDKTLFDVPLQISGWSDELALCATEPATAGESREYRSAMARSRSLARLGRFREATVAADRAITLAHDPRSAIRARVRKLLLVEPPDLAGFTQLHSEALALHDPETTGLVAAAAAQTCFELPGTPCAREWTDRLADVVTKLPPDATAGDLRANLSGLRADLARADGNYELAVAMYQDELRQIEALHGDKSFDLLASLAGLSSVLIPLRRYDEAVAAAARADAISVYWLGEQHPNRATALGQLGAAKLKAGDGAGAIADLERAVAMRVQLEGLDSPRLVSMYNNLAAAYQSQGKPASSLALLDRALALYAKPDVDHLNELSTLRNAAVVAGLLGRADARARVDRLFEVAGRRLADDHPDWALLYQTRGSIELRAGELAAAEADLRQSLTRLERLGARTGPDQATSRGYLALLHLRRHEVADAEHEIGRALDTTTLSPSSVRRAWLEELAAEVAIARGKDAIARDKLARIAPLVDKGQLSADPRVVAHYHLLLATLAQRARDPRTESAERIEAASALRAAEIDESTMWQDCAICTRAP
ncbi:MAG TPA: serine/threonine-protein kinase [Kofleriaceae bacterium]|nr:serine/threonine-protein kinase [Kofleriaceae bacterium]